ncbi:MAG: hypothetical protein JST52_09145 [Bacteroidetes bacterium]|nr:hypothetical protein [Bacteroidota bacterium]MBS1740693.1 hypothetical protein [Bacteroidota bacterium]MBS1775783.1 hypothetical protein [Bacteroidota bacterium]
MLRIFPSEEYREVTLDGSLKLRYAISNFGRLISFTQHFEDGRLLNGGKIEGYRIFRYKIREDGIQKHRHKFFYRMVAEQFLVKPSDDHRYVLHLDHNMQNDQVINLKWATKEEMLAHQKTSPKVQEAKQKLVEYNKLRDGHKLTPTKVIMIKRALANPERKTRMKMLAKQFGISEMQLYRIKSGENWGHIKI